MSVGILVERSQPIALEEWRAAVSADGNLRIRTEDYFAVNPSSGATIRIRCGEADSEIEAEGEWHPFLRWRQGTLTTEYQDEFENPANPLRRKLVEVSRKLGAVLCTDLRESLKW
jgi:hypothetical protein